MLYHMARKFFLRNRLRTNPRIGIISTLVVRSTAKSAPPPLLFLPVRSKGRYRPPWQRPRMSTTPARMPTPS